MPLMEMLNLLFRYYYGPSPPYRGTMNVVSRKDEVEKINASMIDCNRLYVVWQDIACQQSSS